MNQVPISIVATPSVNNDTVASANAEALSYATIAAKRTAIRARRSAIFTARVVNALISTCDANSCSNTINAIRDVGARAAREAIVADRCARAAADVAKAASREAMRASLATHFARLAADTRAAETATAAEGACVHPRAVFYAELAALIAREAARKESAARALYDAVVIARNAADIHAKEVERVAAFVARIAASN